MKPNKLKQVLAVANKWEESGKAFFIRNSNGDMTIHIRDPRMYGESYMNHWHYANELEAELIALKVRLAAIYIDRQSGTLVISVIGVYKENK